MGFVADFRTVIRGSDFRRLFATRLVSQTADGVFQVALAGYVFFSPERQTSAAAAAGAFATLLLPYSIVGPFAGVFIDRWARRQILVVAPMLRAALVGLAALLIVGGNDGPPFYLAALAVLSVNRFFLAALGASLPHVVPRDQLVMGNAVAPTSGTIMTFAGAGLGYLLRLLFGADRPGTALILVTAGVAYAATAVVALTMRRELLGPVYDPARPQATEALRRVLAGLADGARHLWQRRPAAAALGVIATHRFLYGLLTIMTVLVYRNYFRAQDVEAGLRGFALAVAVSGVGYLTAALITPQATRRLSKQAWIGLLLAAAAVVEAVLVVSFTEMVFLLAAFMLGIVSQGIKICVDTIVQQTMTDAYRGRVFSFYDVLFNTSFVLAAAVAALTMPASGQSDAVLGVVTAGYAGAAVGYWLVGRASGLAGH